MLLPMISMLLPILSMPVITRNFGAAGWSAVAVGISVGTGGAVLVDFAWTLLGPQRVASAHEASRAAVYALATRVKVLVFLAVAPVALGFAAFAPSADTVTTVLVCSAFLLMALGGNWFFIGCGRPRSILLTDLAPRAAGVVSAVIAMELGGPLQLYGWFLLLAALGSGLLGHIIARVTVDNLADVTSLRIALAFRRHRAAILGRAISSMYISLPVTLVAFAAPGAVHVFAAADSLLKMCMNVLSSVISVFQKYVGSSGRSDLRARFRMALLVNGAFGLTVATGIVILGPFLLSGLMSGTLTVGMGMTVPMAGIVLVTCISRAVGSLGLVAIGHVGAITVSACLGAAIGVPAVLLGAGLQGAELALSGMLLAEVGVMLVQILALSRKWRST